VARTCRLPFPILLALLTEGERERSSRLLNQWRLMQGALAATDASPAVRFPIVYPGRGPPRPGMRGRGAGLEADEE